MRRRSRPRASRGSEAADDATVTDGSENLIGALRQSMAALGARTIADMQRVEMVYAPSVQTEGKSWQRSR